MTTGSPRESKNSGSVFRTQQKLRCGEGEEIFYSKRKAVRPRVEVQEDSRLGSCISPKVSKNEGKKVSRGRGE